MSEAALFGSTVYDIERCPRCGVATPLLTLVFKPTKHLKDEFESTWWHFTAECSRCKRHTLFYGWSDYSHTGADDTYSLIRIRDSFPAAESVDDDLPERARRFLQQALDSRHAPDGALMLAASAIDAMLKAKGYKIGTLYSRIEDARSNGLLTEEMRDWAHEIRLSANEPRHADDEFDGASPEDADQCIQFTKALGEYLFVLPARVEKWKRSAATPG